MIESDEYDYESPAPWYVAWGIIGISLAGCGSMIWLGWALRGWFA